MEDLNLRSLMIYIYDQRLLLSGSLSTGLTLDLWKIEINLYP